MENRITGRSPGRETGQARGSPPPHPDCSEAGRKQSPHPSHQSPKGARGSAGRLTALVLLLVLHLAIPASGGRVPVRREENIWVHLARNALNVCAFCLSGGASVKQMFASGLIGVGAPIAGIKNYTRFRHFGKEVTYWDLYALGPSVAQKDADMFSVKVAAVRPGGECLYFTGCTRRCLSLFHRHDMGCSENASVSVSYGNGHTRLPAGWFLLCGLTGYTYVPANGSGGPCSLGRLALPAAPAPRGHPTVLPGEGQYLSLALPAAACGDSLRGWSPAEFASFAALVTAVMVASPRAEKGRLACSIAEALDDTGAARAGPALERGPAGEAGLERRAALDYVRLRHDRGCDRFEGLCCFNLSDAETAAVPGTERCEGFCGPRRVVIVCVIVSLLAAACGCLLCLLRFRSRVRGGGGGAKGPLGDVRLREGPGPAEGPLPPPAPSA